MARGWLAVLLTAAARLSTQAAAVAEQDTAELLQVDLSSAQQMAVSPNTEVAALPRPPITFASAVTASQMLLDAPPRPLLLWQQSQEILDEDNSTGPWYGPPEGASNSCFPYMVLNAVLCGTIAVFLLVCIPDFVGFMTMVHSVIYNPAEKPKTVNNEGGAPRRSLLFILGLTFYRFYTGFLSATWLPFLLAMEGVQLMGGKQALFMGVAKLIYGFTIFLNPVIGLIGDKAATMSHRVARRLFIRIGIIIAALGIIFCRMAGPTHQCGFFLFGLFVWRVGESFNDVTTEALCPEMLPREQFEVSSAIRAAMFLVGGLAGYVAIALMSQVHYTWLYYAYLVMMFLCGIPPLLFIGSETSGFNSARIRSRQGQAFFTSLFRAYITPAQFKGGFPRACLCTFLFSFGSAPIFFIMLMIRDLVGIEDAVMLQKNFSFISIDFFLCAACATIVGAVMAPAKDDMPAADSAGAAEIRKHAFLITAMSAMLFGIIVLFMPIIQAFHSQQVRSQAFYVLAGLLGATFGSVYSRFQDCTWQLLPRDVEVANAMGFATMAKLLGAGLGNFVSGVILSFFRIGNHAHHASATKTTDNVPGSASTVADLEGYKIGGYIVMCVVCALCVFASGALTLQIPSIAERDAAFVNVTEDEKKHPPKEEPVKPRDPPTSAWERSSPTEQQR